MATVKGQLGAIDCAGDGVLRDVYTVPNTPDKEASVLITLVNRTTLATLIRLAHIKNGVAAGVATKDYIWYDLDTNDLVVHNAPMNPPFILTMAAGDTIAVSSSAQAISAQVNGIEGDAP